MGVPRCEFVDWDSQGFRGGGGSLGMFWELESKKFLFAYLDCLVSVALDSELRGAMVKLQSCSQNSAHDLSSIP